MADQCNVGAAMVVLAMSTRWHGARRGAGVGHGGAGETTWQMAWGRCGRGWHSGLGNGDVGVGVDADSVSGAAVIWWVTRD